MSTRITVPDYRWADVEVEIADRVFDMVPMTRSKQAAFDEAEKALEAASTTDEVVEAMSNIIGVATTPRDSQRKTAGAVLIELWKADKIEMSQITGLLEGIQAAIEAPPT